MRSIRLLPAALLLSLALAPSTARAQSEGDKTTARELGQAGEAALSARDFKSAEDKFQRANALYHAPTLVLGLARSQAALGQFVEAWENYHSIVLEGLTSPPAFAKALADAQAEIGGVEGRRATVTVRVTGPAIPTVTLDDAPLKVEALGVARFVDPGAHVVRASAPTYKPVSKSVSLVEGGAETVTLSLERDLTASAPGAGTGTPTGAEASSGEPSSWGRTASYVSFGVGGAGLVEGIVTGVLALGKHSDLAKVCTPTCPPSESSELSSYHTIGALSTVGFIVAGVGAATGVVLLFAAPSGSAEAKPAAGVRLVPTIGLGSAGLAGSF